MNVLELFSGTHTLSDVARARGHRAFTIDLVEPADLQADIAALSADTIRKASGIDHFDMVWASPPCQGFSVAVIGRMWAMDDQRRPTPKHPTASLSLSLSLLEHTVHLTREFAPTVYYIENPRGMARKMECVQGLERATITWCQYGENRQKPTDIWHNNPHWHPRPACGRGDPCHEAAPRGSRTGTQGVKGARARGKLPEQLCIEVIEAAERALGHERS